MSLLTRRSSSCRYIYSTNTPQRKEPWLTERRESTLTASHICHRPCIPFRHVLIEIFCVTKHCKKRKGCNKKKERPNPPAHKQQQRTRFKPHKKKNNTCETCDLTNLELSYIYIQHHTTQRKAPWPQRGRVTREYMYTYFRP